MDNTEPSRLDRLKVKFEENKTLITAGAGFAAGVATTMWCIELPAGKRYPWGTVSARTLPTPLLGEEAIRRRLAAGVLFDLFIRTKGHKEEFDEFANNMLSSLPQP